MESKYWVDQEELAYICGLMGIREIPFFWHKKPAEEKDLSETVKKSLLEKSYIRTDAEPDVGISAPLYDILKATQNCRALMSGTNFDGSSETTSQFAFYFEGERILFLSRTDGKYGLFELPSLQLAIGALASQINEYKNQQTVESVEFKLNPDSLQKGTMIMAIDLREKERNGFYILADTGEEQFLFIAHEKEKQAMKPTKLDFVKIFAGWMEQASEVRTEEEA